MACSAAVGRLHEKLPDFWTDVRRMGIKLKSRTRPQPGDDDVELGRAAWSQCKFHAHQKRGVCRAKDWAILHASQELLPLGCTHDSTFVRCTGFRSKGGRADREHGDGSRLHYCTIHRPIRRLHRTTNAPKKFILDAVVLREEGECERVEDRPSREVAIPRNGESHCLPPTQFPAGATGVEDAITQAENEFDDSGMCLDTDVLDQEAANSYFPAQCVDGGATGADYYNIMADSLHAQRDEWRELTPCPASLTRFKEGTQRRLDTRQAGYQFCGVRQTTLPYTAPERAIAPSPSVACKHCPGASHSTISVSGLQAGGKSGSSKANIPSLSNKSPPPGVGTAGTAKELECHWYRFNKTIGSKSTTSLASTNTSARTHLWKLSTTFPSGNKLYKHYRECPERRQPDMSASRRRLSGNRRRGGNAKKRR